MTIHCEPNHGLAQILRNLSEDFGVIIVGNLTNGQHMRVDRNDRAHRLDDSTGSLGGVTGLKYGWFNKTEESRELNLPGRSQIRQTLKWRIE